MNIKLPIGFLDSLSDKCKKELLDKASTFQCKWFFKELYQSNNARDWYTAIPNDYSNSMVNAFEAKIITNYPNGGHLVLLRGFKFSETDNIPEEKKELERLKAIEKEHTELKRSLEIIKSTIGKV